MLAISGSVNLMVALFIISAMAGVGAWFIFVWAIKDKQFEDIEDVAERMNDLDARDVCEVHPSQPGAKS